jgi:hypothetical protein
MPILRMLIDEGAIINLMSYSFFKKMGKCDEEIIKTNMMINNVGGGDPIGTKGVATMELTVGSKTLATAFFIAVVQGNYSVIQGRDWIHANRCIPSTLHQFLIQWLVMILRSFMRIHRLALLWSIFLFGHMGMLSVYQV